MVGRSGSTAERLKRMMRSVRRPHGLVAECGNDAFDTAVCGDEDRPPPSRSEAEHDQLSIGRPPRLRLVRLGRCQADRVGISKTLFPEIGISRAVAREYDPPTIGGPRRVSRQSRLVIGDALQSSSRLRIGFAGRSSVRATVATRSPQLVATSVPKTVHRRLGSVDSASAVSWLTAGIEESDRRSAGPRPSPRPSPRSSMTSNRRSGP